MDIADRGRGDSHLLSIYTANSQKTLSNNPLVEVEGSISEDTQDILRRLSGNFEGRFDKLATLHIYNIPQKISVISSPLYIALTWAFAQL